MFDQFYVVIGIYELLKLVEAELISFLKSSIVFSILLNCIVGQMNTVVLAIIKDVFEGRCAEVAFTTEEHLHILVYQDPHSDIKLTVVN